MKFHAQPTAKEKRRVEVEKLFVEGLAIRDTEGQGETALKKLEAALQGWQALKDEYLVELTTQQIKQLTESATKFSNNFKLTGYASVKHW